MTLTNLIRPRWIMDHKWPLLSGSGAAVSMGFLTAVIGAKFADKPVITLGIPIIAAALFLLVLNPPLLFLIIIATRAALDPVFQSMREAGGSIGGAINAFVLLFLIWSLFSKGNRASRDGLKLWAPLLLIAGVSLIRSPAFTDAIRLYLGLLSCAACFCMARALCATTMSRDQAMRVIVLSSIIPITYAIVLTAMGKGGVPGRIEDASQGFRIAGGFSHPNILAFYLLTVIAALLQLKSKVGAKGPSVISSVTTTFYLLTLVAILGATKTRSAWVGCGFVLITYATLVNRRYLLLVLLVAIAGLFIPDIRDRVLDLASGNEATQWAKLNSYAWRKLLWEQGIEWMKPTSYLFGNGYESFKFHTPDFFQLSGGANMGAHSVYVQIFFEWGTAGIAALAYLFFGVTRQIHINRDRSNYASHLTTLGLIVATLFTYYSDNVLAYLVSNWYLWFYLGAVSTPPFPGNTPQRAKQYAQTI